MNRFKKALCVAAVSALLVGNAIAAAPESDDPILIVQNNWTSQLVLSHVVGNVLMEMGYEVEYTPSDSQLQFTAIANGDMHFQVEAWEGSMKSAFEKALEEGMVDAGSHSAETREEWWIPNYVLETCPEATNWEGLNAVSYTHLTLPTICSV